MSVIMCVERTTHLSFFISLTTFLKFNLSSGSRPAVGSSSKTMSGFPINACAIPSLRFIPPDSFFTTVSFLEKRLSDFNRLLISSSVMP